MREESYRNIRIFCTRIMKNELLFRGGLIKTEIDVNRVGVLQPTQIIEHLG